MNGLKINIHPCSMKKTMKTDPEAIRKKFGDNYIADDRTFKMGLDLRFAAHIADRFQGRNVLETCTGGGFTNIALARVTARVITVEIDPAAQAQARKKRADSRHFGCCYIHFRRYHGQRCFKVDFESKRRIFRPGLG